jgi:hypothetical protein
MKVERLQMEFQGGETNPQTGQMEPQGRGMNPRCLKMERLSPKRRMAMNCRSELPATYLTSQSTTAF